VNLSASPSTFFNPSEGLVTFQFSENIGDAFCLNDVKLWQHPQLTSEDHQHRLGDGDQSDSSPTL
jgi:hypothetical protein